MIGVNLVGERSERIAENYLNSKNLYVNNITPSAKPHSSVIAEHGVNDAISYVMAPIVIGIGTGIATHDSGVAYGSLVASWGFFTGLGAILDKYKNT